MAQCVSAMRAPLTWQRSATYTGMVIACMHSVMSYTIAHAYTKLASSATCTVLPTMIQLITPTQCARLMTYRAASHTGHCLNGFILAIAVLAITSRLCIRVAAQNMNSTLQLALFLCVVARVRAAWLMH